MRKLLIAVLLIVMLFAVGWLSFRYDGRQASVNFNTDEARQDTRDLVQKTQEVADQAAERGRELVNDVRTEGAQSETGN